MSVAVADFNGDGVSDFAVANRNSNNVTVFLGDGSGGFSPASGSPFAVGTSPTAIAAADFNKDGKPDLAVANGGSNDVTLLLGTGSGTFVASGRSPVAVGTDPISIISGDFNLDGLQDLAVANLDSKDVTVLLALNTSDVEFVAAPGSPFVPGVVSPTLTAGPSGLAVGDFNGDGTRDIAVVFVGISGTRLLLGNGSGGFTLLDSTLALASSGFGSIVAADFNRDGILDIAVAQSSTGGGVFVSLGDGAGGFTHTSNLLRGPYNSIALGDFNGDGNQDVAAVNPGIGGPPGAVSVLLGNGAGTFSNAPGSPYTAGHSANSVAVGDFNRDGELDLAIANSSDNNVTVLLNSFPFITSRPASLTINAGTGQPAPPAIPVTVNASPAGSTWSANSNQPWLSASPASNPTGAPATETISVNHSSLNAGTYSGAVA
ncbi:MAG TPA: VCBS repeat-containing protein, partial [Bryobacteraceae bacterium]